VPLQELNKENLQAMARIAFLLLAICFAVAAAQELHRDTATINPQAASSMDAVDAQPKASTGAASRCGLNGLACNTPRCPCSAPDAAAYCHLRRPGVCSKHPGPTGPSGPAGPTGK
jgi:hypothetical protein